MRRAAIERTGEVAGLRQKERDAEELRKKRVFALHCSLLLRLRSLTLPLSLCGPVEFEAQEAEKQQEIQKVVQEQERKKKEEQEWRLRQVPVPSSCPLSLLFFY